jgi:hypothetical protein
MAERRGARLQIWFFRQVRLLLRSPTIGRELTFTALTEDDPRIEFVPLEVATIPPAGLIEHLKDKWWVVHPTKGVVYFKLSGYLSPQCNGNEEIARRFVYMYPWAEVKFIPSVFRTINPHDYV